MGGVIIRTGGDVGSLGVVERDRDGDSGVRLQSGDSCFLRTEQGDMHNFDPRSVLHVLPDPRRDTKVQGDDAVGSGGVADSERFAMLERKLYAGVGNS